MAAQDLAQPLGTDRHRPVVVVAETAGQVAQTPPRESQSQRLRARRGRRDDEVLICRRDPAGTATAHGGSSDAIAVLLNRWIISRTRSGDVDTNRAIAHRVTTRRREHDHRPTPPHHRVLRHATTPTNDPLQLMTFMVRQTTNPQWFRHTPIKADTATPTVDAPPPQTFVGTALAFPRLIQRVRWRSEQRGSVRGGFPGPGAVRCLAQACRSRWGRVVPVGSVGNCRDRCAHECLEALPWNPEELPHFHDRKPSCPTSHLVLFGHVIGPRLANAEDSGGLRDRQQIRNRLHRTSLSVRVPCLAVVLS